mmetsp:Transcript_18740/g.45246  ORF Transcript_18740/g.45246 Transcript_18740/m.45246 type:complete len:107 (-) Transcript_18740:82-402(-)
MLAAPLSLIIQTRPAKIWLKTAFYFLSDPPSILLTLLPAPQQTILGVSYEESYAVLYGSSSSHGPSSEEEDDGEEEEEDDDHKQVRFWSNNPTTTTNNNNTINSIP